MKGVIEGSHYRITDTTMGQTGSVGTVMDGEHIDTGEPVAIKEVNLKSKRYKKSFQNELYAIEKLSGCDKLVNTHSAFVLHNHGFIVMERLEKDLLHHILEKECLDETQAKDIFYQVLTAVKYMHDHQFCHRDIKPENILIDITCNNEINVKLCDFGTAKEWKEENFITGVCGTVLYCAPEVKKRLPYDPVKADVYSLGVLLHVMLTGLFPFEAKFTDQPSPKDIPDAVILYDMLSSDAGNLIEMMMRPSHKTRIDLEAVFRHSWLKDYRKSHKEKLREHIPQVIRDLLNKH